MARRCKERAPFAAYGRDDEVMETAKKMTHNVRASKQVPFSINRMVS